ncbi:MAG TPA: T9SS type A sorting domain-containing protein [Paludibacter sp.]|nr:T9SS type A sorting domain-containing protein [Paludibacter sp.]
MKKLLFILMIFLGISQTRAQSVVISESTGWLESAFIKWQPAAGADSYNVYYSGNGITNRKIDTQLIRNYGTYFRADVLGLQAGTYTFKVVPVTASIEGTGSETGVLTVLAQDRTGFAFANGRVPGAYKMDGTPKDNALIIYITQNTKNTISLNVTGATTNPCVGLQTILDGFKKGKESRPLIVRLVGQITDLSYMLNGDIVIENDNNATSFITFEGVGNDAVADGWGIRIKNASNIEIRNLGTMNCDSGEGDNIGLQQNNDYVWVHNCDLFYGNAGSDADQIKGDGAMDCKKSTWVTFSYNHFWDTGKSNLLGLSEGTTTGLYITYHHNWYDHSDSRHPRVRFYSAHVYNNYYDGIAKYGVGSTEGSSVFVENNFFRNCKYPMLTSMQGTDIFYDGEGTFSGEDGGTIKSFNNSMSGQNRYVPYNSSTFPVEFDAVEAASRGEVISGTIKSKQGANTYNNFDTNASLYVKTFIPDEPEVAKTNVMTYAGRTSGGDLKWTFNNAVDDVSYAVNTALKATLSGYKTKLVSVQGEGSSIGTSQTLISSTDNSQTVVTGTAIEPMIFTWGGDATDASVTGLPASGVSFIKNASVKTITVSGTPTANVTFTVTTSGSAGTPATLSGSVTVTTGGGTTEEMIHNFTISGKTSAIFAISGNMNSTDGSVSYSGLSLTKRLKIESSTSITFTTTEPGKLTLVFDATFNGAIKVDGTSYNAVAGIAIISLAAGSHTISKGDVANLFYISMIYNSTGVITVKKLSGMESLKLYPNPVINSLNIYSNSHIDKVEIYNMSGILVRSVDDKISNIDLSNLNGGSYLVKVFTKEGYVVRKLVKE